MRINKTFLLFSILFSSASLSYAQANNPEKVDEKDADVVITARVQAKEVTFEAVPTPKVEFTGSPENKTEWSSERRNLPESVQPGVTYRDIGITLKIVSRLSDIERILDEALGKPSKSDQPESKPSEPQPVQTQTKP